MHFLVGEFGSFETNLISLGERRVVLSLGKPALVERLL